MEARGGSEEAQRYALVHDAAEAYLSDVPGPVKKSLPGYKHAERRLDGAVVEALTLQAGEDERKLVGAADEAVGEHELAVQFPEHDHETQDLRHDPDAGPPEADAKEHFRRRAQDIGLQ